MNTIIHPNVKRVITMGDKFQQKWGLESDEISIQPIEALVEFQEKQESPLVTKLNKAVLKKATSRYVTNSCMFHLNTN